MAESMYDLLECSVCLDFFKQPKVLPCQHTYCLECLDGLVVNRTITCPNCRGKHTLTGDGAKSLPDNLMAKALVARIDESMKEPCNDCKRRHGLSQCQHCQQRLCGDCRAKHAEEITEIRTLNTVFTRTPETPETVARCTTVLGEVQREKLRAPERLQQWKELLARANQDTDDFLDILQWRLTSLTTADNTEFSSFLEKRISKCQSQEELKTLKQHMQGVEEIVGVIRQGHTDLRVVQELPKLVTRVQCGEAGVRVRHDDLASKSTLHETGDVPSKREPEVKPHVVAAPKNKGANMLPKAVAARNVNYVAKNSVFKMSLFMQKDEYVVLHPTRVIYSETDNFVYCVSGGSVVRFSLDGQESAHVPPRTGKCWDIVIINRNLLMVENDVITVVNLDDNSGYFLQMGGRVQQASHVKRYQGHFVVLDTKKKCLLTFTEAGIFVREFGNTQLCKHRELTCMTADTDGNIYVGVWSGITRKDCGELSPKCPNSPNFPQWHKSVQIRVTRKVLKFSWIGEFIQECLTDGEDKMYHYTFDTLPNCGCGCYSHCSPNKASVPTDDEIRSQHQVRAMCVDGDGRLCLATSDKIHVYTPDLGQGEGQVQGQGEGQCQGRGGGQNIKMEFKFVCDIGDPVQRPGEFNQISDLDLLPDGRMLVCDTVNHRIQII